MMQIETQLGSAGQTERAPGRFRGRIPESELPDLQVRLLAQKSRLETARTHVATAAAWARARKKML